LKISRIYTHKPPPPPSKKNSKFFVPVSTVENRNFSPENTAIQQKELEAVEFLFLFLFYFFRNLFVFGAKLVTIMHQCFLFKNSF